MSPDNSEYKIYSGSDQNRDDLSTNHHDDIEPKNDVKTGGGSKNPKKGPAWTTTKQSMSYVIVREIESDTSWLESEWPLQIMIQLISNSWDWLHDYYRDGNEENRKISVYIKIDSIIDGDIKRPVIRIRVRNLNVDSHQVFEDLHLLFDYTQFHSTKRHQHRMVTGALGDFLKRGLGMGYASWTEGYDRERNDSAIATNKQWAEPVIFRHNGREDKVFIHVEWDQQDYWANISEPVHYDTPNFTEVQVTLPLDSILRKNWNHGIPYIVDGLKTWFEHNMIGKVNTDLYFEIENESEITEMYGKAVYEGVDS